MANNAELCRRAQLEDHVAALEAKLAHELTMRGFDPVQVANIPLPPDLADLYAEIEKVHDQINSSEENANE